MAPGLTEHDKPGPPVIDLSPEARRKEALKHRVGLQADIQRHLGPGSRFREVLKRVLIGTYTDGFIHAGNLAYMAMLTIFPFFITGAAIFAMLGEKGDQSASINTILIALPRMVADTIRPVANSVSAGRSGWLLWGGGIVGLWSVGSLVETVRDILRRAYGTRPTRAFWFYRLVSSGFVIIAVVVLLLSLVAQVMIGAAEEIIAAYLPELNEVLGRLAWSRIVPAAGLYLSIYVMFYSLTPATYRVRRYPKWPGALLVTLWWVAITAALPPLLHSIWNYDRTYGSLAGIMIALFFFWLVGLGMVMGAELNAALAETPEEEADRIGQADDRDRSKRDRTLQEGSG
ncbi:MAG: YihY/virulence factor BrkB family protein [Croceibacterium sp.]